MNLHVCMNYNKESEMIKMKFNDEEKDIIITMIQNELEYYEHKEDFDDIDAEFVEKLKEILRKLS